MKKILLFISLVGFCIVGFAQMTAKPNTANFYFISGQNSFGTQATLNVVSATPQSIIPAGMQNYVCFECQTSNSGEDGGKIRVLVPQWTAVQFYSNYGSSKTPKPVTGTLTNYEWPNDMKEIVLIITN